MDQSIFFSIDVECVATGTDHNSRAVAQISLVDQYERILLNLYVKPERQVTSYLTPLTGLTKELLEAQGIPLGQAVGYLRQCLPVNAVLVGQNIAKDCEWLNLREGRDYKQLVDLAGLYRIWNPKFKTYSVFNQDHLAKVLLNWDTSVGHNAVSDAIKSIRLYKVYLDVQSSPARWQQLQEQILAAPVEPSFAKRNPTFEGVCMGNRKSCKCGAPFLG